MKKKLSFIVCLLVILSFAAKAQYIMPESEFKSTIWAENIKKVAFHNNTTIAIEYVDSLNQTTIYAQDFISKISLKNDQKSKIVWDNLSNKYKVNSISQGWEEYFYIEDINTQQKLYAIDEYFRNKYTSKKYSSSSAGSYSKVDADMYAVSPDGKYLILLTTEGIDFPSAIDNKKYLSAMASGLLGDKEVKQTIPVVEVVVEVFLIMELPTYVNFPKQVFQVNNYEGSAFYISTNGNKSENTKTSMYKFTNGNNEIDRIKYPFTCIDNYYIISQYNDVNFISMIIDKSMNILLKKEDCIIDRLIEANKKIFVYKRDESYGLMNIQGKELCPPKYHFIGSPNSEGYATVYLKETEQWKLIELSTGRETDKTPLGKTPMLNETKTLFAENLYLVERPYYIRGIVDITGKTIVPFKYSQIKNLGNGYVKVARYTPKSEYLYLEGIFNLKTGKEIIPTKYSSVIRIGKLAKVRYGGKTGLIDLGTGAEVLPLKYDNIYTSTGNEKYILVQNGNIQSLIELTTGKESILSNTYESIELVAEKYMITKLKDKYSCLEFATGKQIVGDLERSITYYDGYITYISNEYEPLTIQLATNKKYPFGIFSELKEINCFFVGNADSEYSVMDKQGNLLIPFYNTLRRGTRNFQFVVENEQKLWGVVGKQGVSILPLEYEDIAYYFSEGLIAVVKNKKMGYVNEKNQVVIPFQYDYKEYIKEYSSFQNGKAKVSLNGKEFWIDKTGKCIEGCN
jgi:hypothetical protein